MPISGWIFLAVTIALLAIDVQFTTRRIKRWGFQIETNSAVRLFGRLFGLPAGIFVGLVVPNAIALSLFSYMDWPSMIAFWAGTKATLVLFQYKSLDLEAKIASRRGV